MATSKKAQYAPPASQVDLEARLENGNASDKVLSTAEIAPTPDPKEVAGQSYAVEGNKLDGYIGTSPEYMTYANDTEKPGHNPEDSVEDEVAEAFLELMENKQPEKVVEDDDEPAPAEPDSGTAQPQA